MVVPWTLRNHALLGRPIPVSTVGWMAAAEGNSLDGARWLQPSPPGRGEFRRAYLAVEGEVERAAIDGKRAVRGYNKMRQEAWRTHDQKRRPKFGRK